MTPRAFSFSVVHVEAKPEDEYVHASAFSFGQVEKESGDELVKSAFNFIEPAPVSKSSNTIVEGDSLESSDVRLQGLREKILLMHMEDCPLHHGSCLCEQRVLESLCAALGL